ncbi:MAG: HD domain-containing protein [bacterium]
MQPTQNYKQTLDDLATLYTNYYHTHRASTNPFKLEEAIATNPDFQYGPDKIIIRENLAEHVGSLPIVASFLHPYIEHKVDLGKALQMLAIHDIAETTLGDENIFSKSQAKEDQEFEETMRLLHPSQHEIFKEFEAMETNESKFAKSIDKLTPDLIDYLCQPEVILIRFSLQMHTTPDKILELVRSFKTKYMLWDGFLKVFHETMLSEFEKNLAKF